MDKLIFKKCVKELICLFLINMSIKELLPKFTQIL